jgi:hypothetical protein
VYLLSAWLIVIDEISMLTPCLAQRVSLILGYLSDINHHDEDFGERLLLFVSDLLQLSLVIKYLVISIIPRMIIRFPCWSSSSAELFQFQIGLISIGNLDWSTEINQSINK